MPLPGDIDPAAVWTAIQAIQGANPGALTPNTTTGYVPDNFNPGGVTLPTSPFGNPGVTSVSGAVNDPSAPTFPSNSAAVNSSVNNPNAPSFPTTTGGGQGPPAAGPPGTGNGVWGNPATQDSPDAWFAKAVLAAIGNPTQLQHILDSVNGPNGPQGSLKEHYLSLIQGVMAGNQDKINEAKYYAGNPSDPYGSAAQNNG